MCRMLEARRFFPNVKVKKAFNNDRYILFGVKIKYIDQRAARIEKMILVNCHVSVQFHNDRNRQIPKGSSRMLELTCMQAVK